MRIATSREYKHKTQLLRVSDENLHLLWQRIVPVLRDQSLFKNMIKIINENIDKFKQAWTYEVYLLLIKIPITNFIHPEKFLMDTYAVHLNKNSQLYPNTWCCEFNQNFTIIRFFNPFWWMYVRNAFKLSLPCIPQKVVPSL